MKDIIRFYLKSILFGAIILVLVLAVNQLFMFDSTRTGIARLTDSMDYTFGGMGPVEIVPYIETAQDGSDSTHKLILGDSVAHQLFPDLAELNPDYSIIPSNGALTVSGQYVLAHLYLESHPDAEAIYLFLMPGSLKRRYDTTFGYQYAAAPFVLTGTLDLMDPDTVDILKQTYGSLPLRWRVANYIEKSGAVKKVYLNTLRDRSEGYYPTRSLEIANKYLTKIKQECDERGVTFMLYPCPVCETGRSEVDDMIANDDLSVVNAINPDFFDQVIYYDAVETEDGHHFAGEYRTQENFNAKLRVLLAGTPLEDDFRLE